jgi:hypothetical protein
VGGDFRDQLIAASLKPAGGRMLICHCAVSAIN